MAQRKPRTDPLAGSDEMTAAAPATDELELTMVATDAAMYALLERARSGDESTLPAIRALLRDGGERAIRRLRGDLAEIAEERIVAKHAGANVALREATRHKPAALRAELAGPDPTPIEALLAERAALCWLALYRAEAVHTAAKPWDEYYLRRVERAQRMYLSSLKALAQVRKLALPAIQVNVGARQVNVAGGGSA